MAAHGCVPGRDPAGLQTDRHRDGRRGGPGSGPAHAAADRQRQGGVMPSMPAAEVDVDGVLVRTLIADQHPDLAGRELTLMANGWDNVMFRLGGDLVVRLPRRALAAELVKNEQKWLPLLAPRLPLPIPVPVR